MAEVVCVREDQDYPESPLFEGEELNEIEFKRRIEAHFDGHKEGEWRVVFRSAGKEGLILLRTVNR